MVRAIFVFMVGILGAAILLSALSVYEFHDVDQNQIGHWNEAFAGLCIEAVAFALIIGTGVTILTLIGRHLFHLSGYSPHWKLAFFLGVGVPLLQYLWDFASRVAAPKLAGASLSAFLVAAIVLCSILFLRDAFRQRQLCQAGNLMNDPKLLG